MLEKFLQPDPSLTRHQKESGLRDPKFNVDWMIAVGSYIFKSKVRKGQKDSKLS